MSLITASQAIERLSKSDVVALPTETVYGLCGRIDSEAAIKKIFATKQRPSFDPLIVHVAGVKQARELSKEWPLIFDSLTEHFWPGPLTVIAKKRDTVSGTITSGLDTVAIRCPRHPVFLEVLGGLGVPLAAPSANRFGHTSPTTAGHVEQEFTGAVPIVDGGACAIGVESTVITAELKDDVWRIKILRPGGVSRAELKKFLTAKGFRFELTRETSMASPGNLKNHYQPTSPLVLLQDQPWSAEIHTEVERQLERKIKSFVELRLPRTPQEAARVLYAEFHRLSDSAEQAIWLKRLTSQSGEDWEVVWDRVERAASVIL